MIDKRPASGLGFSKNEYIFMIVIVILGLLAVWSYFSMDQRVFSLLSQKQLDWHKGLWLKAFTYLGKAWVPIWLLLIWFLSTGRQRPVLIVFLALIMVALTVTPLKYAIRRPRPYEVIRARSEQEEQIYSWSHLSFPSGDTAVVFATAAALLSFVTWPSACLLLAAAAGIALLRVTSLDHYPSDIFAGAAIGFFTGWLAIRIDGRWLPLERLRFILNRRVAISGIIVIPFVFMLPKGIDKFVLFLGTYGSLVILIFLVVRVSRHFRKMIQ